MNRYILCLFLLLILVSCGKSDDTDQPETPETGFVEEFDQASAAASKGWVFINRSVNPGSTNWTNPSEPPFAAFSPSGSPNGYLWADFNSTSSASGIISNWALSPPLTLRNGDRIRFYTRAQLYWFNGDSTDFANRLQVRVNPRNEGTDVGSGANAGDFNTLLLDINPAYAEFLLQPWTNREPAALSAFPHQWTRFEATVSGLAGPSNGRFAFRYFMEGAGTNGRGSAIGIDRVEYLPAGQ
jgi:hypothetical protein